MKYKYIYPDELDQYYNTGCFIPYWKLWTLRPPVVPMEEGMYGIYDEEIKFINPCWYELSNKATIIKLKEIKMGRRMLVLIVFLLMLGWPGILSCSFLILVLILDDEALRQATLKKVDESSQ